MMLNKREITLFHTNDIHSQLDNVGRVDTILQAYRAEHSNEEIVLVDIGDFMDRMSLETEGTDGLVHRDLLNTMHYDVITLGNNEGLSFTHEQLSSVYSEPKTFKVVCCNMSPSDGTKLPWLLKSEILERNGIKLAFIGVTINYTSFYSLLNWQADDPFTSIQDEINILKEKADIIILLSHLGITLDKQLAELCPAINIIIGGHTHHIFDPPEMVGNTLMCAAGMAGRLLGKIHISVPQLGQNPILNGEVISTDPYMPSDRIIDILEKHRAKAIIKLDKTVTVLDKGLETDDLHESELPNLLAEGLRKRAGTDLAVVNSGQLLASLPKGKVTLMDIHSVCPSPINACIMALKGEHIKQAFFESLQYDFRTMTIKGYGFRGRQLGYLAVSGFEIVYGQQGDKLNIVDIYVNGKPLKDEEMYMVATIDMFTFKRGYVTLGEGQDIQYILPDYIRHILADALADDSLIERSKKKKWIELT